MIRIVLFVARPPRETYKQTGAFLLIRPQLFRSHLYTAPFFLLPLHALPLFPFYYIVHLLSAKNEIKKATKNTLHPFSNVENVVKMFLIVIIKAKSGYV